MTLFLFKEWLETVNERMKRENSKIILILDNAPVHPIDIELSNVELLYYPPNVTSIIQPLDQGIIRSFKSNYRQKMVIKMIFEMDQEITENVIINII